MLFSHDATRARLSLSTIDSVDSKYNNDHILLRQQQRNDTHPPMNPPRPVFSTVESSSSSMIAAKRRRAELARVPTNPTRYMEMLLHLDKISRLYNILAALSTWIILAAFLVIPGTFTTFKNTQAFKNVDDNDNSDVAHAIIHSAAHIGLLWVSGIFAILGAFGCTFLWIRWRENYVWLCNRVFLPALLNSFAGLLTTIINVYTAQKGVWSVTAKITAIVTSSSIGVSGGFFGIYTILLDKVKAEHERELDAQYRSGLESLSGKFKRGLKRSSPDLNA